MELAFGDYLISDRKERLDRTVILDYLARSYWANERSPERILRSIEASACYGVYYRDQQVGFARIVTDGATMFYLCDVFVLEAHQGSGLGKKLIETIVHAPGYEWMTGILGTKDAHGLYEKYGFESIPGRFMRRMAQAVPSDNRGDRNER